MPLSTTGKRGSFSRPARNFFSHANSLQEAPPSTNLSADRTSRPGAASSTSTSRTPSPTGSSPSQSPVTPPPPPPLSPPPPPTTPVAAYPRRAGALQQPRVVSRNGKGSTRRCDQGEQFRRLNTTCAPADDDELECIHSKRSQMNHQPPSPVRPGGVEHALRNECAATELDHAKQRFTHHSSRTSASSYTIVWSVQPPDCCCQGDLLRSLLRCVLACCFIKALFKTRVAPLTRWVVVVVVVVVLPVVLPTTAHR